MPSVSVQVPIWLTIVMQLTAAVPSLSQSNLILPLTSLRSPPSGGAQGSEINVKCIAREVLGEFKHGIEARRQAVQSSRPD